MKPRDIPSQLRLLSDPLRLRILGILTEGDLSVTDLVGALEAPQPRISTHLARLSEAGLVEASREGRFLVYALKGAARTGALSLPRQVIEAFRGSDAAAEDRSRLQSHLADREGGPSRESLGRVWVPGRTWESFARLLLQILPSRRIADLGCGQGDMALLLAGAGSRVIAVDRDEAALEMGRRHAAAAGCHDLIDFRAGDLEAPPIEAGEVDMVLMSQVLHLLERPEEALRAAVGLLPRGAPLFILDLQKHQQDWVLTREGHRCLGYEPQELVSLLTRCGLTDVKVVPAGRDLKSPHFVSLLAKGTVAQ